MSQRPANYTAVREPLRPEKLPRPAVRLGMRATQLADGGDGRYRLDLIVVGGRWLLIVNDGQKVEDLGSE